MADRLPASQVLHTGTEENERALEVFRRWGYLAANLDPLRFLALPAPPELKMQGEAAAAARKVYCGSIGAEFMHIWDARRRAWIAERMESPAEEASDRARIVERLVQAEVFEQVLQSRYIGTKRYSLEGLAALIPLLDELASAGAERGAEELVLAMSHRGRLNAMAHIVGRSPAELFATFEDVDPQSVLGGGDVKYHIGATGIYHTLAGRDLVVRLVSNPSHLEAVDPVAMGRVRAKQARIGQGGSERIFPVTVHGDGAFAGQGILAETLNLDGIAGYSVGGTIHVIANNLIGFTTTPAELHSSLFAGGLARRQDIPIFHVNGEDLDAVVRAARIACDYRAEFAGDVVLDVIGFRRHGHSEVDDPTVTQPLLYAAIKEHPPLWQICAARFGLDATQMVERARTELAKAFEEAAAAVKQPVLHELPDYWEKYERGCYDARYEVDTGVDGATLGRVAAGLTQYPEGFAIHPKVKKLLEERAEMGRGIRPVNFGMAEALAFGTLLIAGTPVRFSGQDTRRGTFSQRHAALIDTHDESAYVPLEHLAAGQARCEILNSPLSEGGVLGFEYGYSRDYPEALVLWEAQFGDFANGAQVIIDQFIAAAEDKWDLPSGIVLLLPHGYEGQGPEHSSARLERFLQLAAEDNIQICQPSDAAQYFHLLRRQALRGWRKPLVVFTPKSMLRSPEASSPLAELSRPRFVNVIGDGKIAAAQHIIIGTGKIVHELRRERARRGSGDGGAVATAIMSLEQLYPFPETELAAELARHASARDIVWVQEEPANMGALSYVLPRLKDLADGLPVRSVKRLASASPATGSAKAHEMEQKALLALAFATSEGSERQD